ncbi:hypothetical protein B0H63DRAFT_135075 [Podospora didyma]|uniref:Uncharacterized protein n=1 Tax=Podospora didyma TaxID=330526 RepID=A0AAE0P1H4_9PEZI|nr:hypothetical protein B0H63DRAFT_135075 [Podospora didyma]
MSATHGGAAPFASLTSIFSPPCPTSWLLTTTKLPSQYPAFPTRGPSSCDPPSWTKYVAEKGFAYYSPAICPRGFAVGSSCRVTATRTNEGFPAIAPDATAAYCVPVGLTCTTDTTDFRGGIWGFRRETTTVGALVTVGPAVQIRWAETDLTMLETHPLTPGLKVGRQQQLEPAATRTTASARSSFTTSTVSSATKEAATGAGSFPTNLGGIDTSTSNNSSAVTDGGGGSGGISRTATIVIIVSVTVVVGLLLWVLAFLLIRRRKARRDKTTYRERKGSPGSLNMLVGKDDKISGAELGGPPPGFSELDSGQAMRGSTPNPAELDGHGVGDLPLRNTWMAHMHLPRRMVHRASQAGTEHSARSSVRSSPRRTIRESFGEKANDPAAALGRLRISQGRSLRSKSTRSRSSPRSSPISPRRMTFGKLSSRSPLSPSPLSPSPLTPSPLSAPGSASRLNYPQSGVPEVPKTFFGTASPMSPSPPR